jgi:hypothetical protein
MKDQKEYREALRGNGSASEKRIKKNCLYGIERKEASTEKSSAAVKFEGERVLRRVKDSGTVSSRRAHGCYQPCLMGLYYLLE